MFFIHLEMLFEKQVLCFSNFLQKQHVKMGCTMQSLTRRVYKNVWSIVETLKIGFF